MRLSLKTTLAAAALAATPALADDHMETIPAVAMGNDNFTTLVAAVQAAELVDTLSGEGPFTVFAPTNDAFAALPEGTVEGLLEPDMKGDLTNVLLYHVLPAQVMAGDIPEGTMSVDTALEGQHVCVTKSADGVMIDDGSGTMAHVIMADVGASNGVIHAIDKVLMPGGNPSCM